MNNTDYRQHMVLPPNFEGRDFLLGDLHGCVDMLENAMALAHFDKARDRIICVGDLIDRGPRSHDALLLARESWFFSTLGNHEIMMLEAENPRTRAMWLQNGGEWFYELSEGEQATCLEIAAALPVAITLELRTGGSIGICHAEWPGDDWADVADLTEVPWMQHQMLWGRTVLLKHKEKADRSAALTVHGHTPLKSATRLGTALFIDTGAVLGGQLTLMPVSQALRHPALGSNIAQLY
ncbi:metallophosphoesterase [Kordiimonas gwangyangensis]|uniref:metallophosphoesterase n=1 Tax=Kordiimonas gwangyangensis TaxID=288022 RepID=UPI0012DD456A|nr:metallophosphoesterase [Kordiimonas gwangyangensis]